jgi:hypothetical protein
MNYNIFCSTAPAMPSPAKGTEFVKLLLSQASKELDAKIISNLFCVLQFICYFCRNNT